MTGAGNGEQGAAGWEVKEIGSLVAKKVEQAPPKSRARYIEISGIDRKRKRIVDAPEIDPGKAPTRARQWVKSGDVLVSLTRPNLNAVAQVPPELDGAVASTGFDVLRPESVSSSWLAYRVQSPDFVKDVCQGLQGVVYPAIRPKEVRSHRLPVPPLAEQVHLVAALDSYFSRLDDVEAGLERVQRNLNRYRASVLQAAVTGRLVPTEAELARVEGREYEPASALLNRALLQRRERLAHDGRNGRGFDPPTPSPGKLFELPEGWCWARFGQLLEAPLMNGRSVPDANLGFPVLRLTALKAGGVDFSEHKSGRWSEAEAKPFLVQERDFLIARGSGSKRLVGRGGLVLTPPERVAFPDTLIRARVAEDCLDVGLLAILWNSDLVRRQIEEKARTTAGIYKVNQSDIESISVPLAPVQEQARLRRELERLLSIAAEIEGQAIVQERRSMRLRQSLLSSAFAGQLAR